MAHLTMHYFIGIIITFFLVLLLLTKKNKSSADRILALWLFFIGIHLSLYYLHSTQEYLTYPYFLGFELPLPLTHGPFLYLYTAALTNRIIPRTYKLLHFLPTLLAYTLFLSFFTLSYPEKIVVYQQKGIAYQNQIELLFLAIIASGITYVILSLLLLKKHKKNIEDQYSYSEKINLNWLRYLIWGIGLIWIVVIIGHNYLVYSAVVLYVIFIGYFGIKQVGVFTQGLTLSTGSSVNNLGADSNTEEVNSDNLTDQTLVDTPEFNDSVKYQKSSLKASDINQIHDELTALMQREKLYLNPELTLSNLAQELNTQPNNLSQVINSVEKRNFFDYINSKRVEEFKLKVNLPENRRFTLLALALECGFNSKTSFNRNFKKVTGLSPSEYLNQENIDLS